MHYLLMAFSIVNRFPDSDDFFSKNIMKKGREKFNYSNTFNYVIVKFKKIPIVQNMNYKY